MQSTLDELIGRLDTMPHEQRVAVTEDAIAATADMKWLPSPGPQTDAYFSQADVLLYGGQAAGGKISLKRASFRLLTLKSCQPLALTRLSSGRTWPL